MLRTDVLALVLLRQLHASGPCPEREALEVLNIRAPGRSHEILDTAMQRGMVRRVMRADTTVALEAAGAPREDGGSKP
jgi:hypothetical protein